jgi:uncharacterized membrane protein required for colicin V production
MFDISHINKEWLLNNGYILIILIILFIFCIYITYSLGVLILNIINIFTERGGFF